MNKIALIAPDDNLKEKANNLISKYNYPVDVFPCYYMDKALKTAEEAIAKGAAAIISRGGAASLIRGRIKVPFVELKITGFDMINVLKKAIRHTSNIGVVGYEYFVTRAELLKSVFPIHLVTAMVHKDDEVGAIVEKLAKQGVEAFIGGQAVMNAAKEHHVAGLLLETSDESLREAIQEAAEALKLQLEEQEKTEILRSILDSVYDGIISVDANEHVTVFNSKAEILTGIKREEIINRKIGSMLPEMEIEKIIKNGKSELGSFKQIGNTSLVFNKLPIIVNNHIRGVVTTFQETKNIQRIENQLRRKLLHKGYIAKTTFDEIIGKSDIMKKTILRAQKFSAVDSTVLITGETGTGKELFAQSIHRAGKRANKPFLAVNCAALPESLLESELFGYVDGAFTGAKKEGKPGLFELAHSGTIFLDEISEMSLSVQARFLRVLQEKEVTRIGDDGMIAVDIRIIAATNKRLLSLVEEDKFREDLYHRLVVLPLHIPPLRERKEDIRDIANAYLHEKSADLGKPLTVISPEALDLLMLYHWPGNVRQLLNVLERAIILCDGPELDRGNIVEALGDLDLDRNDKRDDKKGCGILKDLQEEAIRQALLQSNGNKSEAARKLGINAATLWRKLKKFDGY